VFWNSSFEASRELCNFSDPLFDVIPATEPFKITSVRVYPTRGVIPTSVPVLEIGTDYPLEHRAIISAKLKSAKTGQHHELRSQAELPSASIPLNLFDAPYLSGSWILDSLTIIAQDGRTASWSGSIEIQVSVQVPESAPLEVTNVQFDPPFAAPGDTVSVIIDVTGGEPAEGVTLSGKVSCRLASNKVQTVWVSRPSPVDFFIGRLTIPDSLTEGTVLIESVALDSNDGQVLVLDSATPGGLLPNARLTIQ
jgi:hypothetical protein